MNKKVIIIFSLLSISVSANCDTWLEPTIKRYYSSDSTYFVDIIPRKVPAKYYRWINATEKRKKRFHPSDTLITPCHAIMYKNTPDGIEQIWEQKLINRICPVTAIVSESGEYLVTFDNWYSMGYGVDVMVVYNSRGELLKRHMLEDISPFPINTYSITISSLWWRCGQEFINNYEISICFQDENDEIIKKIYNLHELKINEHAP